MSTQVQTTQKTRENQTTEGIDFGKPPEHDRFEAAPAKGTAKAIESGRSAAKTAKEKASGALSWITGKARQAKEKTSSAASSSFQKARESAEANEWTSPLDRGDKDSARGVARSFTAGFKNAISSPVAAIAKGLAGTLQGAAEGLRGPFKRACQVYQQSEAARAAGTFEMEEFVEGVFTAYVTFDDGAPFDLGGLEHTVAYDVWTKENGEIIAPLAEAESRRLRGLIIFRQDGSVAVFDLAKA